MARKKNSKSKSKSRNRKSKRNPVAIAINKIYKKSGIIKDKRLKRKSRNSWKLEIERSGDNDKEK